MIHLVVALHIYRGGGLDPLHAISRANSADLANQSRKEVGTLTDPVHAWTVRATSADCPAASFSAQQSPPMLLCFLGSA
jgi:hypothetical protein